MGEVGSQDRKTRHLQALSLPSAFCLRPDGLMYQKFRNQFLSFSMYQSECLRSLLSSGLAQREGRGKDLGSSSILMPSTLQASCSSCSITTRAAACTAFGLWARGTPWTSLWVSRQEAGKGRSFALHLGLSDSVCLSLVILCPPLLPHRGLPVLDVARPHLPAALSFLWTCKLNLCPFPPGCPAPALAGTGTVFYVKPPSFPVLAAL